MAPEFYDHLPCYSSWLKVIYDYIRDPEIGPYARVCRKNKIGNGETIPRITEKVNGHTSNGYSNGKIYSNGDILSSGKVRENGGEILANGKAHLSDDALSQSELINGLSNGKSRIGGFNSKE